MITVFAVSLSAGASAAKAIPVTERVSVDSAGVQGNGDSPADRGEAGIAISGDGRLIAFDSSATNLVRDDWNRRGDVFLRDRTTHLTVRIAEDANFPMLSADGRTLAVISSAALVDGDTNGGTDVYVRALPAGGWELASPSPPGTPGISGSQVQPPELSHDGVVVAFASTAPGLVPEDDDGSDVFVRDRRLGSTVRVGPSSEQFALSDDGDAVAFISFSAKLTGKTDRSGLFVYDRRTGITDRISVGGSYASVDLSGDGRYVAFVSSRRRLVPGDTNGDDDVFVFDRVLRATTRASVSSKGVQANNWSASPSLSGDGSVVAFESYATNLVHRRAPAGNVFVHDRTTGATRLVSSDRRHRAAGGTVPEISADARFVAFASLSRALVHRDTNNRVDVFVRGPYPRPTAAGR